MYLCSGVLQKALIILLNFSDELQPQTRFNEHNLYIIGAAHHSAVSNHRCIGAVAGLSENMGRGLRFLYTFELVLSPQIRETKVITK